VKFSTCFFLRITPQHLRTSGLITSYILKLGTT
jgi:hypothetical protein